jgi:magnesium transporter
MKRRRPPRRHRTSLAPTAAKVGLPPGELRYTGTPRDDDVRAHLVAFDGSTVRGRTDLSLAEAVAAATSGLDTSAGVAGGAVGGPRWLDIVGVHDLEALKEVGRALQLHPLTLEDLAHVGQRPKVEDYDDYLLIVARSWTVGPAIADTAPALRDEQVAIVLRGDLVVTFRERPHEAIDALRGRWGRGRGRVREGGASYLTYALLDLLVDQGFVATEALSDALTALEERVLEAPHPTVLT